MSIIRQRRTASARSNQRLQINWANQLTQGLAACFDMTEGVNAPTELVSNKPVVLTGTTSWVFSPYGKAFTGDGTTGSGSISLPAMNPWTSLTLALFWAGFPSDNRFGRCVELGGNTNLSLYVNDPSVNNRLYARVGTVAGATIIPSLATIANGLWHMIHVTAAGSADGSAVNFYVDGVLQGSGTTGGVVQSSTFNILRFGAAANLSRSKLGQIWLWNNRALSLAGVQSHFSNPFQTFQPTKGLHVFKFSPISGSVQRRNLYLRAGSRGSKQ